MRAIQACLPTGRTRAGRVLPLLLSLCIAPLVARGEEAIGFALQADQVAPPSGSTATGRALATLSADETSLAFIVQHDIVAPMTATVHRGDMDTNGPVVFTFSSATSQIVEAWDLSPADVTDFRDGKLYLQITSNDFPDGEIRGQIAVKTDLEPGDVIISEIMYNPASSEAVSPPPTEWIELFNPTFNDVQIGGLFFSDEDAPPTSPCVPRRSGSVPPFVLRSGHVVVIIPDGPPGATPSVETFKSAWNRPDISVLQLLPDGTAEGGMAGGGLANDPANDGNPLNDLPLGNPAYSPCTMGAPSRPDNEILTLQNNHYILDVVNYDDVAPWPVDTGFSSITLVTADYPARLDTSTYSPEGNDVGSNWRSHQLGDAAGGFRQARAAGVYGGQDIGSPGFLLGATSGNQPPVATPLSLPLAPGQTIEFALEGSDATRPFFGLLLFIIKSLPQHGTLIDVGSNHVITPADVAGDGYLLPRLPLDRVKYIHDGSCEPDSFTFAAFDALEQSSIATVELLVQCGDLVITEIMYDPDSHELEPAETEWVEIYNAGTDPVDLAGWYLAGRQSRSGDFPSYVLGAKSSVVVVPPSVDPFYFANAWCGLQEPTGICPNDMLELRVAGPTRRFRPGETVTVELHQRNLSVPVTGYQAFLQYDAGQLIHQDTNLEGCPGDCPPDGLEPYALPLLNAFGPGELGVAAAVDIVGGQPPAMVDAPLATFTFEAANTTGWSTVAFRSHVPATRFSDEDGQEVTPCLVESPPIFIDDTPSDCPTNALELRLADSRTSFHPGEIIELELYQTQLGQPVSGYQAFIRFDSDRLTHLETIFEFCPGGSCPPAGLTPYGLVINQQVSGDSLNLAAGIDVLNGQTPVTVNARLARIRFVAGNVEGPVDISFRPADPPSRFTSELGEPVTPCLRDAPAIWIDLSPPPVTCSVIQPTTAGQLGPGGLIGDSLANHGEALRLHAPGTTISDAVVFDDGLDADSQWPTVAPGGPSIYVLPPPESYDNFANDDPTRWAASQAGVDEAYAVNPNIVFDAADFSPPFESDDVGSPGKLAGLVPGDCGQTATLIDGNGDGVVDLADFAHFALCLRGPVAETPLNCTCMDADYDGDVDLQDFLTVQADIDTP